MRSIRSAVGVIPRKEKLLKESGCSPVVSLWCWFSTSLDGIIFSYLSLGVVFIVTCCYLFGSALFFFLLFFLFPFFFPYKNAQECCYQIKHQSLYLVEQSEEYA